MLVRKTVRIPVHYETTKSKLDRLGRLTARLTYCISLINGLVSPETSLDRKTLRRLVKDNNIARKTGLSSGYVDQCIDRVLWAWRSYEDRHGEWRYRYDRALEELQNAGDDGREKLEKRVKRLQENEPSTPVFLHKVSCRLDFRTGRIERGENSFLLWMHVSTLEKGETMDVPLNPSYYHLKQLEGAMISDFEIIRKNGKYYAHISTTRFVDTRITSSYGGIDQGLNRTLAIVLLDEVPREELLYDEKRNMLDKYDDIIASLQSAMASARHVEPRKLVEYHKMSRKLKQLRGKRNNVSVYHDWLLANKAAEYTDGYDIAIGNTKFRQTQYRGNGMPSLRKRIGKWSYGRQRIFIAHKRAERGLTTMLVDERNTSNTCRCGSRLVARKYHDGASWLLCHSCGSKLDAGLNAAYNIALRCRDDRLKVRMNAAENRASA
ncbi:Transposase [Methanocella conradii HZ254]|uniref:Transposase n=1 Tax=Methanocella conradii (strain DSM 24694 / JCM 17849 / CGMCC 1.5162 / HZ254) TaxID=1041930 RepID=H8I595_METCZ|nr:zinc ribbon domain-containing protein [Methanocella conradii]AFC99292.1 Transposase [Methanocella conradii HZ254]